MQTTHETGVTCQITDRTDDSISAMIYHGRYVGLATMAIRDGHPVAAGEWASPPLRSWIASLRDENGDNVTTSAAATTIEMVVAEAMARD